MWIRELNGRLVNNRTLRKIMQSSKLITDTLQKELAFMSAFSYGSGISDILRKYFHNDDLERIN